LDVNFAISNLFQFFDCDLRDLHDRPDLFGGDAPGDVNAVIVLFDEEAEGLAVGL
jgi:hypothetical protein